MFGIFSRIKPDKKFKRFQICGIYWNMHIHIKWKIALHLKKGSHNFGFVSQVQWTGQVSWIMMLTRFTTKSCYLLWKHKLYFNFIIENILFCKGLAIFWISSVNFYKIKPYSPCLNVITRWSMPSTFIYIVWYLI